MGIIGQILNGRYEIQRQLGDNAVRRTFLARDLQAQSSAQELVVVKLLTFSHSFTWDDLKLFEREAETLKHLSHPAIPRYLDYFDVELPLGKGFALVQSYVEGKSLQEHLKAGRTFSEDEIIQIAKDLLGILTYLHQRQPPVIHRDIKPSNILLSDRHEVYLVDFGSVQTKAARAGSTITVVGTYGYMPPEQFGGRTVPASDLYALGATLIYLATGQQPADLPQKESRIFFESAVSLNTAFVDWLKWMTEPNVDLRLESAPKALQALEKRQQRRADLSVSSPSSIQSTGKPAGSRVQLIKNREKIEIILPPMGFNPSLVFLVPFAIAWNSFLVMWYGISIATWSSGGWFMGLFAIGHLTVGLGLIATILFTLFGKMALRIDRQLITLSFEVLGFKWNKPRPSPREHICKLELTKRSYRRDSDGDRVEVKPQINIWAGVQKYEFGGGGIIVDPELEWLAQELSDWLGLPITSS
ncbi:serine/threonine protein kinase [Pseudanabaena sp. PCC 6802]|uniref:serine/threonine protein kinase n=1 Tax=Pseudanabaena sp. PCC 6802 TaxID=118173 RepID=UPI000344D337|nr:serine/threonine-protein kinase [Pseudanabaena sp. PCC 6802]